jgi:potassium efflux system protein
MNRSSGAEAREALATLRILHEKMDDWVKVADLRLAGGASEISDLDPTKLRTTVLELRAMQRLVAFTIDDLGSFDLRKRGTPVLDRVIDTFHAVWNAELYLVEENDIVDGKKIPIYRAITVGKVFRLAVILVVGWFLLKWISRRIKGMLAKRGTITPESSEVLGNWVFRIGLCLLVLYGLNAVRIPLTAFAFLGGALAIGVGFGTQTILKNLISGIILHLERPLKVGDVVEVSAITGTIRKIGMRASVIQHFDGIETLVPNSVLLENQLTNWTFSSTVIRHSVIVGVAYGSPTREVSRVLLAVADSHGLVKKDPPPEVRFDNFGADSLTFTLLFWLDTNKTGRNQLASDLRYMIDKALAEAGITIAFPQRDIHFDRNVPLRVEIASASNSKPET